MVKQNQRLILGLFFYSEKKELTLEEIQRALETSYFSTWRSLDELVNKNLLRKTDTGKYYLSQCGFIEAINEGIGL